MLEIVEHETVVAVQNSTAGAFLGHSDVRENCGLGRNLLLHVAGSLELVHDSHSVILEAVRMPVKTTRWRYYSWWNLKQENHPRYQIEERLCSVGSEFGSCSLEHLDKLAVVRCVVDAQAVDKNGGFEKEEAGLPGGGVVGEHCLMGPYLRLDAHYHVEHHAKQPGLMIGHSGK